MPYEHTKDGCTVSDDQTRLDFDVIHGFLRNAYWCEGVPREVVERAARHALSENTRYEFGGAPRLCVWPASGDRDTSFHVPAGQGSTGS